MKNSTWMRFLLIVVSVAMVLSLFACGGNGGKGEETTAGKEETTAGKQEDTTVAGGEDTTVAGGEDTTVAGGEDTTVAGGEDTTVADGEDTTVADGEDTTVADGEDTTVADGEDTTVADGEDTTVADGEDTTVADEDTTAADEDTTVAGEDTTEEATTEEATTAEPQIWDDLDVAFAGDDLATMLTDGDWDADITSAVVNADGTVTAVGGTTNDKYFGFALDGTVATGQYLVIKYKTTAAPIKVGQIYYLASTVGNDWAHVATYGIANDGRWHTLVIDLSKNAGVTASEADGKYYIQEARVDFFDALPAGASVDFAYVGLCDDLNDIQLAEGEYIEDAHQKWGASVDSVSINGEAIDSSLKDSCNNEAGASPRENYGASVLEGTSWGMYGWTVVAGQDLSDISYCVVDANGVEHWTTATLGDTIEGENIWWLGESGVQAEAANRGEGTVGYRLRLAADLSAYAGQTVNISVRLTTKAGYAVTAYAVAVAVPAAQ